MKEIISLFLGRKSNYVSTHFWNTLDEYYSLPIDFDRQNVKNSSDSTASLGDAALDWEIMYRNTKV
jgi:hypothetical protein